MFRTFDLDACFTLMLAFLLSRSEQQQERARPLGGWACTNGLTKCASSEALQSKSLFCVPVHTPPQVYSYNREEERAHFNVDPRLQEEEQASPILIWLLVGAGIAGPIAIGTSAFSW